MKKISVFDLIKHYWNRLDNNVIKPFLLHNWPHSKNEHEEITIKIQNLFSDYKKMKGERKVSIRLEENDNEMDDNELIDISIRTDNLKNDEEKPDEQQKLK
jgi:hypothetical protein